MVAHIVLAHTDSDQVLRTRWNSSASGGHHHGNQGRATLVFAAMAQIRNGVPVERFVEGLVRIPESLHENAPADERAPGIGAVDELLVILQGSDDVADA